MSEAFAQRRSEGQLLRMGDAREQGHVRAASALLAESCKPLGRRHRLHDIRTALAHLVVQGDERRIVPTRGRDVNGIGTTQRARRRNGCRLSGSGVIEPVKDERGPREQRTGRIEREPAIPGSARDGRADFDDKEPRLMELYLVRE